MKSKKNLFTKLLLLTVFAALGSGCSRDLKLSVRPAEQEKDQASTALVRRLELTYHSPTGKEQLRESIAVLGLSQPVAAESESLKNLEIEKDGVFEARGYTADGYLVLRGEAKADPDLSTEIEVMMSRDQSQSSILSSALLRRFRFIQTPTLADYQLDASEVTRAASQGGCVGLPAIEIADGVAEFPALVIETAIKAPSLKFEVGELDVNKNFIPWDKGLLPVPVAASGDALIEFNPKIFEEKRLAGGQSFILKIYSSTYEGCLGVKITKPEKKYTLTPLSSLGSYSAPIGAWYDGKAFAYVQVHNPNIFPAQVRLKVRAFVVGTNQPVALRYSVTDTHASQNPSLHDVATVEESVQMPPNESWGVYFFASNMRSATPGNVRFVWDVQASILVQGEGYREPGYHSILAPGGQMDIPIAINP